MRLGPLPSMLLLLLIGCASDRLGLVPSPEVDFTGHWLLNEADSDDPQRLLLTEASARSQSARRQSAARAAPGGRPDAGPPPLPALGALTEALRWPGRELKVTQAAGAVAITSGADSRVFQPSGGGPARRDRREDERRPRARDPVDGPVLRCGWEGDTLVVQSGDSDVDAPPFERRFSVSADGRRLIEVVGFRDWRTGGFTVSRVWDRAP